jgi:uncharacterized protein YjcR
MKIQFDDILQEFNKSEEISRISRRSAEDLKEEYCRVVFSVASERRRNLLFIESIKQEFAKEFEKMVKKVETIDGFARELAQVKELQQTSFREILL